MEYQQLTGTTCSNHLRGSTETLEEAKLDCDYQDDCIAVEDIECDNHVFRRCETGTTFKTTAYKLQILKNLTKIYKL